MWEFILRRRMRLWRIRTRISITLSDGNRRRLEAIFADRSANRSYVWRARIKLLSADGVGTNAIIAASGKSNSKVCRLDERLKRIMTGGTRLDAVTVSEL